MSTRTATSTIDLFSEEHIHAQVQKIFLCPAFAVSDILRRFLSYITDETLSGRSNTIKEYTIAVNVLNKPVSFKPQHDAIVRIHAGRLRRALNYYYKEEGQRDSIEISVPKGSYVPVFSELQSKDKRLQNESAAFQPGQAYDSVILVVVPFSTLETDISRQAFTDSLGQQLSAEFGKFSDFSVISYYTTRQLSAKNREIGELASLFGAQYVVTGNVQFESNRLRVAVQLIDTHSGAQIWTEMYHRNYNTANLFEVGDQIVSGLAGVLGDFNGIITQEVARGHAKNKAGNTVSTMLSCYHDFYIYFHKESFKKAFDAVRETIRQDSLNEIAWAFLGELSLLGFLFNQKTQENPVIQGLRSARKALQINPSSQHGYLTLGMAHLFMNNKKAAMESLEQTVRLNPNAAGKTGLAGCLMICIGEYQRGNHLIRKSMELNKSYPLLFHLFTSLYYFKKKEFSKALQQCEIMGMPDLNLNMILRISILSQMDRRSETNMLIKALRNQKLHQNWISRELICRFLMDKELVEELYKGLKTINIPVLTVA
jgi:TolB-like protein